MARSRGRPRQFDEQQVVGAAAQVFWTKGFSATSLDDLAAAMGMNRPSIYRAFGDKEELYRLTLKQFSAGMEALAETTLFAERDIRQALEKFYQGAVQQYVAGAQPKGCLVMSTAVSAATSHPDIQADLYDVIGRIDQNIDRRLCQAVMDGKLPDDFATTERAQIAQSVLHSLSLRARAGASKAGLNRLLKSAVDVILC